MYEIQLLVLDPIRTLSPDGGPVNVVILDGIASLEERVRGCVCVCLGVYVCMCVGMCVAVTVPPCACVSTSADPCLLGSVGLHSTHAPALAACARLQQVTLATTCTRMCVCGERE